MSAEIILLEQPLDEERIEELLAEHDGNVGKVAKKLGVKSSRLRKFVAMSQRLCGAIDEVFEGAVDEAVGVLFEGLRDEMSYPEPLLCGQGVPAHRGGKEERLRP